MWYRTGTIALTNGSTAIVGTGTDFIAGAAVGEGLLAPDGKIYEIAAVVSATSITLGSVYLGSTASGQAYAFIPSQSYIRDLAAQAATLVNTYQSVKDNAGTGKFSDGTVGAPGISFVADTNTGIRRTGADSVAIVTNGVDRVTVNASGTVAVTGTLSAPGSTIVGQDGVLPTNGYNISGPVYGGAIELRANSSTANRGFRFGIRDSSTGFTPTITYLSSDPVVRVAADLAVTGTLSASGVTSYTGPNTASLQSAAFTKGASDANFTLGFRNGSGGAVNTEQAALSFDYSGSKVAGIGFKRNSSAGALGITTDLNGSNITEVTASGLAVTGTLTSTGYISTNVSGPGVQVKRTNDATQANYVGGYNQDTTLAWYVGHSSSGNSLALANLKAGELSLSTLGASIILDGANSATFTGNRPIVTNTNGGNVTIQGNAGGWAIGSFFKGSAGAALGGFGAFGAANALNYYYIGTYGSESVIVDSSGNVGIGDVSGGGRLEVTKNVAADAYTILRNTNTAGSTTLNIISGTSTYGQQVTQAGGYVIESTAGGTLLTKYSDFNAHIFRTTAGSVKATIASNGNLTAASFTVAPVAFASLPASPVAGQRAMINNSVAAPAFLSTAAGGGSTTVPVFYNGTSWLVG